MLQEAKEGLSDSGLYQTQGEVCHYIDHEPDHVVQVITAQVPKEHCGHSANIKKSPNPPPPVSTMGHLNHDPSASTISRSYITESQSNDARNTNDGDYGEYFNDGSSNMNWKNDQKDLFYYLMNKKYS